MTQEVMDNNQIASVVLSSLTRLNASLLNFKASPDSILVQETEPTTSEEEIDAFPLKNKPGFYCLTQQPDIVVTLIEEDIVLAVGRLDTSETEIIPLSKAAANHCLEAGLHILIGDTVFDCTGRTTGSFDLENEHFNSIDSFGLTKFAGR